MSVFLARHSRAQAMRIALGVEYDGSDFCGWQRQPQHPSVQAALEQAVSAVAGHSVTVVTAGRTDRGVHARAQVVHFDTPVQRQPYAWVRGSNAHLPKTVAVRWAQPVPEAFHARFCARSRTYEYWLLNRSIRPALQSQKWGWYHHPLHLEPMQEGVQQLIGTHDFSAFRAAECQAKSPIKTLLQAQVVRAGNLFCFRFRADAFLQHMVRNLVGALVYVGCGRQPPDWMGALLKGRNRTCAAPTFAPDGLYLVAIEYDPLWQIPLVSDTLQTPAFSMP